jgi:hypothetical protein
MTLKEKVVEKEKTVKELWDHIRAQLNVHSIENKKNPNDWKYITKLGYTEEKLREVLNFMDN